MITPEEYRRQQDQLAGSGHGRSSVDDLPDWLRAQYTQSAFDDAGGGGEWFQNGMRDSTGQGVFNANSVGSDNNLQGGGDARGYHITDPSQIRDDPWYGRVINGEYIDDTQNRQIQAAHRQAVRGRGMAAMALVGGGGLLAESGLLGQAGVSSSGLAGDAEMALANETVAGGGVTGGSAGGASLAQLPESYWSMGADSGVPFSDVPPVDTPPSGGPSFGSPGYGSPPEWGVTPSTGIDLGSATGPIGSGTGNPLVDSIRDYGTRLASGTGGLSGSGGGNLMSSNYVSDFLGIPSNLVSDQDLLRLLGNAGGRYLDQSNAQRNQNDQQAASRDQLLLQSFLNNPNINTPDYNVTSVQDPVTHQWTRTMTDSPERAGQRASYNTMASDRMRRAAAYDLGPAPDFAEINRSHAYTPPPLPYPTAGGRTYGGGYLGG